MAAFGDAFDNVDGLLGACLLEGLLESGCCLYEGSLALLIGECYRLFSWYLLCELDVRERDSCRAGYLIPDLGRLYAALFVVTVKA